MVAKVFLVVSRVLVQDVLLACCYDVQWLLAQAVLLVAEVLVAVPAQRERAVGK